MLFGNASARLMPCFEAGFSSLTELRRSWALLPYSMVASACFIMIPETYLRIRISVLRGKTFSFCSCVCSWRRLPSASHRSRCCIWCIAVGDWRRICRSRIREGSRSCCSALVRSGGFCLAGSQYFQSSVSCVCPPVHGFRICPGVPASSRARCARQGQCLQCARDS